MASVPSSPPLLLKRSSDLPGKLFANAPSLVTTRVPTPLFPQRPIANAPSARATGASRWWLTPQPRCWGVVSEQGSAPLQSLVEPGETRGGRGPLCSRRAPPQTQTTTRVRTRYNYTSYVEHTKKYTQRNDTEHQRYIERKRTGAAPLFVTCVKPLCEKSGAASRCLHGLRAPGVDLGLPCPSDNLRDIMAQKAANSAASGRSPR